MSTSSGESLEEFLDRMAHGTKHAWFSRKKANTRFPDQVLSSLDLTGLKHSTTVLPYHYYSRWLTPDGKVVDATIVHTEEVAGETPECPSHFGDEVYVGVVTERVEAVRVPYDGF